MDFLTSKNLYSQADETVVKYDIWKKKDECRIPAT